MERFINFIALGMYIRGTTSYKPNCVKIGSTVLAWDFSKVSGHIKGKEKYKPRESDISPSCPNGGD